MKKFMLLLTVLLISVGSVVAQMKEVSGVVLSQKDNQPIERATVKAKSGKGGAYTDAQGRFRFNVPATEKTLVVSFAGMKTQEVAVGSNIKVLLQDDVAVIDEVLVTAFGKSKKSAFTGSATQVSAEELGKRQVSNVTQAIAGKVPGVSVTSGNNQPGTSASINVRGIGSFSAGRGPLYVVDGVPYDGDISSINPQDVETFTILKDAASAALYGARGANGVILIQTKSGAKVKDAMSITFEARYGVNQRGVPDYDVIRDPKVYAAKYFEGIYNNRIQKPGTTPEAALDVANKIYFNKNPRVANLVYHPFTAPDGVAWFERQSNGSFLMNPAITVGTMYESGGKKYWLQPDDWSKEVFSTNPRQEYNFSLSGRSAKASYYMSAGYLSDKGYIVASSFDRFTTRLRGDFTPVEWLTVGANMAFTHYVSNTLDNTSEGGNSGNIFAVTNFIGPVYPLYVRGEDKSIAIDKFGNTIYDFGTQEYPGLRRPFLSISNPMALYNLDTNRATADVISVKGYADFNIFEGLKATINAGVDTDNSMFLDKRNVFYGQFAESGGIISRSSDRTNSLNTQQLLTYVNNFGQHNLDFLLGHEFYRYESNSLSGSKEKLYDPNATELTGAILNPSTSSSLSRYATEGYLGRAQYNYASKYFAQASFRRDASSRFKKENRWGNFWSVSGSWLVSKEEFMSQVSFVNMLKVKVSYGMQGNDAIGSFRYMDLYSLNNSNDQFSTQFSVKGNEHLTWETSANLNAGIEFSLFNNRLSGGFDIYRRKVTDMLFQRKTPNSIGYGSYFDNVGAMSNTGIDFELMGTLVKTKDLNWTLSVNGGYFKNTLDKLPEEWEAVEGGYRDGTAIYRVGGSIYDRAFVHYRGVNEKGQALYQIYNKEKNEYETTTNWEEANKAENRVILTDIRPYLTGGLSTSLSFMDFDLSATATYALGGRTYDSTYQSLMHGGTNTGHAWHKDILNSWTPENTSTNVPMVDYGGKFMNSTSDRFLVSRSYLALNNITLGYTLPKNLLKSMNISAARVYVVADNLALFSARKGLDPRFGSGVGYKTIRSLSAGVRITL